MITRIAEAHLIRLLRQLQHVRRLPAYADQIPDQPIERARWHLEFESSARIAASTLDRRADECDGRLVTRSEEARHRCVRQRHVAAAGEQAPRLDERQDAPDLPIAI